MPCRPQGVSGERRNVSVISINHNPSGLYACLTPESAAGDYSADIGNAGEQGCRSCGAAMDGDRRRDPTVEACRDEVHCTACVLKRGGHTEGRAAGRPSCGAAINVVIRRSIEAKRVSRGLRAEKTQLLRRRRKAELADFLETFVIQKRLYRLMSRSVSQRLLQMAANGAQTGTNHFAKPATRHFH
jgi:hypothetical protein